MYEVRFGVAVVASVAGMVAGFIGEGAGGSAAEQPNFVLILTDDQGYGDLGCFGSETIATPHLDRMAREGARLTSFYAAAPICTPTRAAVMTGCYAERVGLSTPIHVYDEVGLHPDETTIAEALRQTGYRTGCVGKWHLGHRPEDYPTRHGFDEYWGTPLGHLFDRPAVGRAIGDTSDLFLDGETPIPFPPHGELTERITGRAVEFIREHHERPFFLFVSHPMPHEPLGVSERFSGRSEGGRYGDVIECIDWSTGRIVEAIREAGIEEQTVVVFTSDNGPKQGHGSAGPLRGFKHEPYEGGVRVPCVAWAPGRIEAGGEIDTIANVMDLYPTLVSMAGGEWSTDQVRDGRDLSEVLRGDSKTTGGEDEFFYFVRHGLLAGVRVGPWKLLRQAGKGDELYNLSSDVGESSNLASRHPEIVARLGNRLETFRDEVKRTRRPPAGAYQQ